MLLLFERILYNIITLTKYFRITKNDELKKKKKIHWDEGQVLAQI